jgi:hypothetical protein
MRKVAVISDVDMMRVLVLVFAGSFSVAAFPGLEIEC